MPWKCLHCFGNQTEEVRNLCYQHCMLTDVPTEVFSYERTLEELYLDANRIKDLPRPLFHCHGLKILCLSDNDLQNLPPAIASLISLRHLDISRNALGGIPDNIKCCKQLYYIDVSVNPLEKLPEGFTQLINLEQLYLNDTCLDFLPANFGRLTKLKILELRENNLNTLPKSIMRLSNLERLDIGQNEFSDLPEVIGSLANLTELWVDYNRIRSIPAVIGNLKKLTHFDTSYNNIDWISPEIEKCERLSDLTLSCNELQIIPSSIGYLKELVTLKLDDNQIHSLPDTIGKLTKLEELILNQNDLSVLPSTIGLLRRLYVLYVDDNMLEELPPEIGSCTGLSILSARNNKLQELPPEIGYLPKIKVLNFIDNMLRNLPVSILNLSYLSALWLASNQSTPLMALQKEIDMKTGHTVCINFALPQLSQNKYKNEEKEQDAQCVTRLRPHIRFAAFEVAEGEEHNKLMRAPTPYPKELRSMAKHVKALQHNPRKVPPKEADETTPLLEEVIPNEPRDILIKEAVVKKPTGSVLGNEMVDSVKSTSSKTFQDSHDIASNSEFYYHEANSQMSLNPDCKGYSPDWLHNTEVHSKYGANVTSELLKNSKKSFPHSPPPYHIAACFSKQASWFDQSHTPNIVEDAHLQSYVPIQTVTVEDTSMCDSSSGTNVPVEKECRSTPLPDILIQKSSCLDSTKVDSLQKTEFIPGQHEEMVKKISTSVNENKEINENEPHNISHHEAQILNEPESSYSNVPYESCNPSHITPDVQNTPEKNKNDLLKNSSLNNDAHVYSHNNSVRSENVAHNNSIYPRDNCSNFRDISQNSDFYVTNERLRCIENSTCCPSSLSTPYANILVPVTYLKCSPPVNQANFSRSIQEFDHAVNAAGSRQRRELMTNLENKYSKPHETAVFEHGYGTNLPVQHSSNVPNYVVDKKNKNVPFFINNFTNQKSTNDSSETDKSVIERFIMKNDNKELSEPHVFLPGTISQRNSLARSSFNEHDIKTPSTLNSATNKTSWVFGQHKNVTVFQVVLQKNPGLGFSIAGGYRTNFPDKQGIFVTKIHPDGPAVGFISEGDKILEVDGVDLCDVDQEQAIHIFKHTGNTVHMMISRQQ